MRYDYHYVIVGAGMAADSAARGIRAEDPDGSIVLLGQDTDQPYERPPLSKNLWTDDEFAEDQVFLNTAGDTGAHVHTDTRVTAIDPRARTVTTSGDDVFHYRKLLIATGGTPRELNLAPSPNVIYFRSLSDYHRLRAQARAGAHIVVIGGGFIGTELACALATTEADVTFVTPDPGAPDRGAHGTRRDDRGWTHRLLDRARRRSGRRENRRPFPRCGDARRRFNHRRRRRRRGPGDHPGPCPGRGRRPHDRRRPLPGQGPG